MIDYSTSYPIISKLAPLLGASFIFPCKISTQQIDNFIATGYISFEPKESYHLV